jgi:hypothetical protein
MGCVPAAHLSRRVFLTLVNATLAHVAGLSIPRAAAQSDPLPSWRDGPAKQAIMRFLADVVRIGSPHFAPQPQRIAVFDTNCLPCAAPSRARPALSRGAGLG